MFTLAAFIFACSEQNEINSLDDTIIFKSQSLKISKIDDISSDYFEVGSSISKVKNNTSNEFNSDLIKSYDTESIYKTEFLDNGIYVITQPIIEKKIKLMTIVSKKKVF